MKPLQMYHMKDSCPHSALPVWRNSKTEQRAALPFIVTVHALRTCLIASISPIHAFLIAKVGESRKTPGTVPIHMKN